MAIQIGGHAMPTTMSGRALQYNFTPSEIIARNGDGAAIESANGATLVWVWAYLDGTEYDYLNTTLLAEAPSATFTSATLVNNERTEHSFTHATVLRPTYKAMVGTVYEEVTLVIDQLW